jgi:hypothetical protein
LSRTSPEYGLEEKYMSASFSRWPLKSNRAVGNVSLTSQHLSNFHRNRTEAFPSYAVQCILAPSQQNSFGFRCLLLILR